MPVEMLEHLIPAPGWPEELRVQPGGGAAPLVGHSWWYVPSRVPRQPAGCAELALGGRPGSGRGGDRQQRPPGPAAAAALSRSSI